MNIDKLIDMCANFYIDDNEGALIELLNLVWSSLEVDEQHRLLKCLYIEWNSPEIVEAMSDTLQGI